ncbi:unnamed protein product [Pleuronectes platessa]|uniref:Uncharacterized protein n=1 Tax=Pleuronectes platessa TaxID=8262 RepID=A0A9N7UQ93_PLEPL|nr:unnamed protein product [Pleuronectes platessa]
MTFIKRLGGRLPGAGAAADPHSAPGFVGLSSVVVVGGGDHVKGTKRSSFVRKWPSVFSLQPCVGSRGDIISPRRRSYQEPKVRIAERTLGRPEEDGRGLVISVPPTGNNGRFIYESKGRRCVSSWQKVTPETFVLFCEFFCLPSSASQRRVTSQHDALGCRRGGRERSRPGESHFHSPPLCSPGEVENTQRRGKQKIPSIETPVDWSQFM